jgi:hypothetical protein
MVKKKENLIVDIVMWSTIYLNYKKRYRISTVVIASSCLILDNYKNDNNY